jgi:hypothetical protein
MNKTHHILRDYLSMAHGFPWLPYGYTQEMAEADLAAEFPVIIELAWHDRERDLERILQAKRISRRVFMKTMAVPKPSIVQNLVYCSELKKKYGKLDAPGFQNDLYQLPRTDGILVPMRRDGLIYELRFHRMSEMFKAKVKVPA